MPSYSEEGAKKLEGVFKEKVLPIVRKDEERFQKVKEVLAKRKKIRQQQEAQSDEPKARPSIQELIDQLKTFIPEENFHLEPETSTSEIRSFEEKYQVNTRDFLTKTHNVSISLEDTEQWLNFFETFLLFGGDENNINSIK